MHTNSATIEITEPKRFTFGAVVAVNAYGLLLVAPLFLSILVVSLIKFGLLTILIPFLVVVATAGPIIGSSRQSGWRWVHRAIDFNAQAQVRPPGDTGRRG
jgi:hypothetical protein